MKSGGGGADQRLCGGCDLKTGKGEVEGCGRLMITKNGIKRDWD